MGRFISPDSIIAEPGSSQGLNRYAYANNNPVKSSDPSGHFAVIAVVLIILKIIDYGWTAIDIGKSLSIVNDENSSIEDIQIAEINIALAVTFEGIEPDELIGNLPLDDGARFLLMKGVKKALAEGGEAGLEKYIRNFLGKYADDAIEALKLGHKVDANKLHHIFDNSKHGLDDLLKLYDGDKQSAYNAIWREFSKEAGNYSADELKMGIRVTVDGQTLLVFGNIVDGKYVVGDAWKIIN